MLNITGPTSLVEDEFQTIFSVAFEEMGRNIRCALRATNLFIETKSSEDSAFRLKVVVEKEFERF